MDKCEFTLLNAAGRIPSPKGVALKLMQLIHSETVSIGEMAHSIKSDPALAGRILAAANASAHHVGRRFLSVPEALNVVGTAVAYRLALGLSIISGTREGACGRFDYRRHWLHSVLVALAMQALALRTRVGPPEDAFTVGLMCRIGRLGLATLHPDEYGAILAAGGDRAAELVAERAAFATDDIELGQYMLASWGFPDVFVEATGFVDRPAPADLPESARVCRIARMLRIADVVAECAISHDVTALTRSELAASAATLDLTLDNVRDVWNEVVAAWPTWRVLLEIDAPELPRLSANETAPPGAASSPDAVAPSASVSAPRMQVLAITADPAVRRLIRSALDLQTVDLVFASGDDEALRVAVAAVPQLVIHDWPETAAEGLQICRTLRASAVFRAAQVIVLCGGADASAVVRALDAGADDCLSREVAPEVLAARLGVARRTIALHNDTDHDREQLRRHATELGVANRRLQEIAMVDALTGLPNRRYADDHMDKEWAAAGATGEPLSCLMIDVDNFKAFNDTYGHDTGDAVLAHLASVLRANLRGHDTVCRVGGEEFMVVCRNATRESAQVCAERLRAMVQATPLVVDGVRHAVTVSVGVAFADPVVPDPPALRTRADQALYCAKRQGRNRVAVL
jgi:diguanylate cyclase (GGDEF)-like protein